MGQLEEPQPFQGPSEGLWEGLSGALLQSNRSREQWGNLGLGL